MDYLTRDSRSLWHPFTPTPHLGPRAILTGARGAYVFDQEGKKYFDATSSWWCNLHGHCHPRLVSALSDQAAKLDQILFAPHSHPVAIELGEAILKKLGEPFSKVFFSDDGSTAVEAAMKMAIQYWALRGNAEKRRFVSLDRAYHGDTLGVVAVSHLPQYHDAFSAAVVPSRSLTAPYCYRCPLGKTYPSCQVACLDEGIDFLTREHRSIAALVIEPLVLGAGGMVSYPSEYVDKVVEACRALGILVIFDEVFTGFGRTGTMFAMEQCKSRPDMVCLSKGLTSGMLPAALTVVSEKIHEPFQKGVESAFYHGHTFTGNALSARVALESLKMFDEERVLERNEKLSAIMRAEVPRFRELPHVGDVRHLGMIWALEIVKDQESREVFEPANGPGWKIAQALWDAGVWIRPLNQLIYVIPPYCTSESELRSVFQVLYSHLQNEVYFETK